ncbi:MAG: hypothetical protein CMJ64_15055 [Planctomycetaceae bacterium]|nr:hypothetical protein [Planctomycetaceae bacterium]
MPAPDTDNIVVLFKGGRLPSWHQLMRLEAFQLMTPKNDWHRAWVIELPTLEAAEAWVEGEESLPHGMHAKRIIYFARKWSPAYFASWIKRD